MENSYPPNFGSKTGRPTRVPLFIIIVGTCLLAIPSSIATYALFESGSHAPTVGDTWGDLLLALSLTGFALLFGYVLTAIFERYLFAFWLFSTLYNLSLTGVYYYAIGLMLIPDAIRYGDIQTIILVLLFLAWMTFMTVTSAYYVYRSRTPSKLL